MDRAAEALLYRLRYPRGLSGERLSLEARALRAADAYDALVAERPYKPGRSHAEALATLRAMAGKVDSRCVDVLAKLVATRTHRRWVTRPACHAAGRAIHA